MMKLYVSSTNEIVNKERAQSILKDAGIAKEIDGFSDCKNNCCCDEFKNGLEIRFDSFDRKNRLSSKLKIFFLNPLKNLFIRNPDEKLIDGSHKVGGAFIQETKDKNTIYLFLDNILKVQAGINDTLTHELMHIKKPIGHCDKPFCIFCGDCEKSKERINQVSLCEDCKKNYGKILEEINNKNIRT